MNNAIRNGIVRLEQFGDWLNPILVKDTRQALKSRQFIVTFLLMLVSSWLISVFGVLLAGDSLEFGSAGRTFFIFYYYVLALAIFAVVPYSAYRGLLAEREHSSLELLSITSLSPRQLVWGKLLSAMVQVFVYYSAIAPFIAFTSMLQGFDLALVVYALAISVVITLSLTMLSLMLASFPLSRSVQGGATFMMFGKLLAVVLAVLLISGNLLMETIPFDDREFWIATGCLVVAALSFFALFTQVAISHLTFESDNRSTGVRLAFTAQFVLFWLAMWAVYYFSGSGRFDLDEFAGCSSLCVAHSVFAGFLAATETDYVSRRVRRGFGRSVPLRMVMIPFMPGGHRGFLYFLLHLVGVVLVGMMIFGPIGFWGDWIGWWTIALIGYAVAYLGIGAAIGRFLRTVSAEVKPMHARVITLILFSLGVIVPYMPMLFEPRKLQWLSDVLLVMNPFATLDKLWGFRSTMIGHELIVIVIAAFGGVLLNVRAMLAGISEVLREPGRAVVDAHASAANGNDDGVTLQTAE